MESDSGSDSSNSSDNDDRRDDSESSDTDDNFHVVFDGYDGHGSDSGGEIDGEQGTTENAAATEETESVQGIEADSPEINVREQSQTQQGQTQQRKTQQSETLFPPVSRAGKRSFVWDYGGCKKKDGKLITDRVFCRECGKGFVYNGTPGNLMNHLKLVHSIYQKPEESSKEQQPKIDNIFACQTKIVKYKSNDVKQKKFRASTCKWIVKNLRPLNIVDDEYLREMIEIADPKLSLPSSSTVTREITKMYNTKKQQTVELFKTVEHLWGTTDAGTSFAGKCYIDVNAHWISEDFKVKKKILTVIKVDSKNAVDYRGNVEDIYEAHGIKEKVFGQTTDNEKTMEVTFGSEIRNGCFSHIESKACQYALDSSDRVKNTRKKLRKVAKKANKSSKFKSLIEKEHIKRNLKTRTLKQ